MTAEEFIKSKVINDNGYEQHSCEIVAKRHALTAIEMARKETINSVWHDASEQPSKFCDLLLIKLNNGEYDLGYEVPAKAASWAYVRDLLPKEEEK